MLKRMVVNESKPKDSMIRGPKVDMPPEGILEESVQLKKMIRGKITYEIRNIRENHSQVLTSTMAS